MRQALFMLVGCISGALIFIAVQTLVIIVYHALGGREFGPQNWQTFVCLVSAAAITGLLMLPVAKFLHRKMLR